MRIKLLIVSCFNFQGLPEYLRLILASYCSSEAQDHSTYTKTTLVALITLSSFVANREGIVVARIVAAIITIAAIVVSAIEFSRLK